jgi:ABC-type spermidine/putrescine transport system permease subunit II
MRIVVSPRSTDVLLRVFVGACLVFLFLPVVLVIIFSLSSRALASFPFQGPSLRWYRDAFGDRATVDALISSIKLAAPSSLVAASAATAAAYALVRDNRRVAAACSFFITIPLLLPLLVIGIALVTAFDSAGVQFSLWTAFCASAGRESHQRRHSANSSSEVSAVSIPVMLQRRPRIS